MFVVVAMFLLIQVARVDYVNVVPLIQVYVVVASEQLRCAVLQRLKNIAQLGQAYTCWGESSTYELNSGATCFGGSHIESMDGGVVCCRYSPDGRARDWLHNDQIGNVARF